MPKYVPEKGDFVILTFDPQAGREERGRRPALVVSNTLFNRHTGLAMVCPSPGRSGIFPFMWQSPTSRPDGVHNGRTDQVR